MRQLKFVLLWLMCLNVAYAKPDYQFTRDWTTHNVQGWKAHLGHLKGKPGIQGLEIGVWEGRSSIWFVEEILTGKDCNLVCLDIFGDEPREKRFDHNMVLLGGNVEKIKGNSRYALRELDAERFDFIYVDACHLSTCALSDGCLAWPLLKPGGILIFDDYDWQSPTHSEPRYNPRMGIDVFLEVMKPEAELLAKGWQVILRKKPR